VPNDIGRSGRCDEEAGHGGDGALQDLGGHWRRSSNPKWSGNDGDFDGCFSHLRNCAALRKLRR